MYELYNRVNTDKVFSNAEIKEMLDKAYKAGREAGFLAGFAAGSNKAPAK